MKKFFALLPPFLFTFVSILFLYFNTSTTIAPIEMFRPLAWMIFFVALFIFPTYLLTKNWHLTGLLLTIFVFGFYYEQIIFLFVVSSAGAILFLWFFLSKIRHKKIQLEDVTLLLNFLGFLLILGGGVKLALPVANLPKSYYEGIKIRDNPIVLKPQKEKPDIYYIVLDGYARSDVLQALYGYDNSNFISYLQNKGFVVPNNIHSNYPKTSLSIPSTLNMNYIQELTPGLEESHFWWLMSPLIDHSQVRTMLDDLGYESVSLATDWTITNNKTTDLYYQPASVQISEFEKHILYNTPLSLTLPSIDRIAYLPTSNAGHREMVLYNFETLPQIARLSGPQFIFAHIISPHPPFVFDKNGNNINSNKPFSFNDGEGFRNGSKAYISVTERNEIYRTGYIGPVEFINKELKSVIDAILKNSDTPPIIILQADHGSGLYADFSSSENTCMYERFSPFAAYYLPDIDPNIISDDLTSVNLFRIIFNEYFDADLPLLENAYFFSTDPFYVYEFEEISINRINAPCNIQP